MLANIGTENHQGPLHLGRRGDRRMPRPRQVRIIEWG